MTTYAEARTTLVTHISTEWAADQPAVNLYYENALRVNLDEQSGPFARVEIEFDDARQIDLSATPSIRVVGQVYFTLMIKDGLGVLTTLALQDYVTSLMKHKSLSGVKTATPRPGRRTYKDGWRSYEVITPFWFDQPAS